MSGGSHVPAGGDRRDDASLDQSSEPASFYTGIVPLVYAALRSRDSDDVAACADFVARTGQPALELGCGDGYPLLELREGGLDVHGLDSSADMLARCRIAASARGIEVTLFHQAMETMTLPGTYRAIFLAGPTFNLLPDDATASRALARMRDHLAVDGAARIPLFVPEPVAPDHLGVPRTHTADDGTWMSVAAVAQDRDVATRTQRTRLRYEVHVPGSAPRILERDWLLHWYTPDGFAGLAEAAGLAVRSMTTPDGDTAGVGSQDYDAVLVHPSRHAVGTS